MQHIKGLFPALQLDFCKIPTLFVHTQQSLSQTNKMAVIGIYASVCRHVCRIVPMSSIPYPYDPVDHTVQFCDRCLEPEPQPTAFMLDQEVNHCASRLAGIGLAGDVTSNRHATQAAGRRGKCSIEEYMQQCDADNNDIVCHSIESDSASFSSIDTSVPGAPNWTIETSSHGPSCGGFRNRPMPSGSFKKRRMSSGPHRSTNAFPLFELSYDAIRARFAAVAERVRMQKLIGSFDAMELQPHPSKLSAEENDKLEHMTWLRARLTKAMMQGEELDVVLNEFEKMWGFGVLDFAGGIEACCEFPMC